jgi:hypothetical protein
MASTFKTFLNNDKTTTRTLLHEAIPITGTIMSGTYGLGAFGVGAESNIKNYSHGMFQSVYDYPYLSSSANHILDISVGYAAASSLSGGASQDATQRKNKINMYNQMAQVLMGHDHTGSIQRFDIDGNLADGAGKMNEVIFINFARLLNKDEIKKGSFKLDLGVASCFSGSDVSMGAQVRLNDSGSTDSYFVNSPTGEYGILHASNLVGTPIKDGPTKTTTAAGLIFYQAGIAVITGSIFLSGSELGISGSALESVTEVQMDLAGLNINNVLTASTISGACDDIRHRISNLQFNNTTELNSTIYFCRLNNNEFNYSSNPTYLSSSQIVTKVVSTDLPVSYVTTMGLYSADNELLATAKLSEPLRKDPSNELTVRVRLDY